MDLIVAFLGDLSRPLGQVALLVRHESPALFELGCLEIDYLLILVRPCRVLLDHLVSDWVILQLQRHVIGHQPAFPLCLLRLALVLIGR